MDAIQNATGLNPLDLLLIVIMFIGILIGLVRGMVPQIVSIISIWFSLIITLWTYKLFSFRILQGVGIPSTQADTLSFLILIWVWFNVTRLLISFMAVPPEEKRKKKQDEDDPLAEAAKTATERFIIGPLNAVGAMLMGFGLMTLWMAILMGVLQFIFQGAAVQGAGGAGSGLAANLNGSLLIDIYFNPVLQLLSTSVSLFIPADADIFRRVLGLITTP